MEDMGSGNKLQRQKEGSLELRREGGRGNRAGGGGAGELQGGRAPWALSLKGFDV